MRLESTSRPAASRSSPSAGPGAAGDGEIYESLERHRRDDFLEMALQPLVPDVWPQTDSINALGEGGLAIRVRLRIDFPMHVGFAYL